MAEITGQGGQPGAEAEGAETGAGSAPAPAPTVEAAPTVEEYLAAAPAPIGRVLQDVLRRDKERKDGLIKTIKANARNKFTDEQLESKDADELENIATLMAPDTANYGGREGFGGSFDPLNTSATPSVNSGFMPVSENYLANAQPAGEA